MTRSHTPSRRISRLIHPLLLPSHAGTSQNVTQIYRSLTLRSRLCLASAGHFVNPSLSCRAPDLILYAVRKGLAC